MSGVQGRRVDEMCFGGGGVSLRGGCQREAGMGSGLGEILFM